MTRAALGLGILRLGASLVLAASVTAQEAESFRFVETGKSSGLVHASWCGSESKPHILESGGTGIALFDIEADGDLDLYLINGWRTAGADVLERGKNRLYANRGDGTFEDVTERAGVGDQGWGTGVAIGDADGDGQPDLFVANFGPDVLYLNRGGGRFEKAAEPPGIDGWSSAAVFFDADRDGDEDLFVSGYIDCTMEQVLSATPELDWEGTKVMKGPFGLEGLGNRYFENLGGGSFREATEKAGLTDKGRFYSFGVLAADLDQDLDLDLYVANDSNPNYLYQNDGSGVFQEVGLWSGAALDEGGMAQAGMGVAAADLDGDRLLDLFVTNFYKDASTFYRNLGELVFDDATRQIGMKGPTFLPLSWGVVLEDFDLDGRLEMFIANGHIYPQADVVKGTGTSYRQRDLLLTWSGEGFADVSSVAGPGLEIEQSSRGVAAGDLDGDGDVDLVVANMDAPPSLLRNESPHRGSWLLVDAPGAIQVRLEIGEQSFVRHRVHGGSYVSVSDTRFHFGLGPVEMVDRIVVTWSDGETSERTGVKTGRLLSVRR